MTKQVTQTSNHFSIIFVLSQKNIKHQSNYRSPEARHRLPTMLQNTATTWTCTSPISHSAVTSRPVPQQSQKHSDLMTCNLDSVVMVPFFRVTDTQTQSYRYVCAAKYLGFYGIQDRVH